MQKINLIFMGTSFFAVPLLKALVENEYSLKAIYTKTDFLLGEKTREKISPVKNYCLENKIGIKIFQPENFKKVKDIETIKKLQPGLIIVADYGTILPKTILEIPCYGCLNFHPSLLPKHRGPSPVQTVLLNREKNTGVSLIKMNEQMDEGEIISQKKVKIPPCSTYSSLLKLLSSASVSLLVKKIPLYLNGQLKTKEQKQSSASYTKMFQRKDGLINWNHPAIEIEAAVRALNPWPGVFTFFTNTKRRNKIRIKIIEADYLKKTFSNKAGEVFLLKKKPAVLAVNTSKGSLRLKRIKPEGKKEMDVQDFLNGYPEFIGSILN